MRIFQMNQLTTILIFAALTAIAQVACADGFEGPYVGVKIGENSSRFNGPALVQSSPTANVTLGDSLYPTSGIEFGYNAVSRGLVIGADAFVDFNGIGRHAVSIDGSPAYIDAHYGSTIYGGNLKLGMAVGYWMPYLKLGYGSGDGSGDLSGHGSGTHMALGAEYQYTPTVGFAGELSDYYSTNSGGTLHNTNFTFGLNFYFR